ncbi:DUF3313 domain-containing protein [Paucibacter sp. B2R-40]|jgi:hypothetical protein|uniref:DUF3313 domain-containing protein n=1 Tax=Paucibacter sp. B2R-40 TaxID=2893554 RepID=UPI0021E4AEA6|nr:DUF3313 domain-containing protein [Paucibacter sp. B2R-40]MCV2352724.1 DUF3313 domain-containing protein [Paucibacter sp. B2R-40]
MNRKRPLIALLSAVCVALLAGCASTGNSGKQEWDGLVRRPDSRIDAVFVRPDAELVAFRSVLLDPVQISFAPNFDPNQGRRSLSGRLNADDLAAIKERLAGLFHETFRAELARGGYTLVDVPGPETLRVTPAIVNLFISAPGDTTVGRSRVYTTDSGQMTVVLEIRDSVTGQVLARAVDGRNGRFSGQMTWTNRQTNLADAQHAITIWATALRRGMDEVNARVEAK